MCPRLGSIPSHSSSRRRPGSDALAVVFPTSLSFSAPLQGARVTLSRVAKRKSPKRRPPHEHVLSTSLLRIRSRLPRFADGTGICLRRTGPHPAGHPSDGSVVHSPCSRGPGLAHFCAHGDTKQTGCCRYGQGHGWPTPKQISLRPCTTPSIAAASGSKARMFEHRDVRVRAGPLAARSAGELRQHDVAETVVPGAWLWSLSPKGK
jgi:hypothetical protein